MRAIFKRELRSYFQTVIGWLYLAATLALYGLYFFAYNLNYGYAKVSYAVNAISFLFLLTVPVLTMRSLAEEKKSRTDQLILTSPVSVGKIVLAKYFAMSAVHTIAVFAMSATPLLLLAFGKAPSAENYAALLGFWLYGMLCIAVGLFVSSLTESQVISAVLTFVFLFVGYMMGGLTSLFSASGNLLTRILGCYDFVKPLEAFLDGRLSVTGIVYYATLSALFLFLTGQSIQKRRLTVSKKRIKLGAFHAGYVAASIALTALVNLFAAELPGAYMEIDLTSSKLYSLTDETKGFLKGLSKDVTIYVIASESGADETVSETLKRYEELSRHVTVEYKDPAVSPNFYQEYTKESVSSGSLIAVCGDVSRVIDYSKLYETSVDYSTFSQQATGYDGEGQITSALQYVTSDAMPVLYQLTGHGEAELSGTFADAVEKANITLKSLNLLEVEEVPEDAHALVINGPVSDLSGDDAKKVISYLKRKGNVLAAVNYQASGKMKNFYSVLEEFGLGVQKGLIAEGDASRYYQIPFYLLPKAAETNYTSSVGENYVFVPFAQGITFPDSTDQISYQALLTTSEQAVLKSDAANASTYEYEEGDTKGEFTVAAVAEGVGEDAALGRLLAYGSSEMLGYSADAMVSGSNSAMFSDALKEFVDTEDMVGIVVPVKSYEVSRLVIPAFTGLALGISMTAVLPMLLLAAGIVIWVRRRKR